MQVALGEMMILSVRDKSLAIHRSERLEATQVVEQSVHTPAKDFCVNHG
jgi:hypothetical protein